MPKALGVNVSPAELRLAKTLYKGVRDFEDLDERNKRILYECPLSLEGLVDEETLRAYELELALEGEFGEVKRYKAMITRAITNG